jgi:transposase
MSKPWDIDEDLWLRIGPLLPAHRPGKRGPVPLDDRKCLQGILFVLYTGISWNHLPPELGFGSGITCWRRFRRWCGAGLWDRLHRALLAELHAIGEIDWSTVCLDGSHIRAKKEAPEPDPRR